MSEKKETEFVDGLFVKAPDPSAPDYVIAKLSITRKELGNWLRNKSDEYINVDILRSRKGSLYAKVDNWRPDYSQRQDLKDAAQGTAEHNQPDFSEDVPF